ncbi:MAG: DUF4280 domain-containing protein [Polyangiales bacterium]
MTAPRAVTEGASLRCAMGASPASLTVAPTRALRVGGKRLALVTDHTPANIPPFGMCRSLANPQVAAATSAANGVLTPQPCAPVVSAPWSPGAPRSRGREGAVLDEGCTAQCAWGAVISIDPGGATARAR